MVSPGAGFPRLTLLAPQGAEYRAVRRGADPTWPVLAVPLGTRALPQWWADHQQALGTPGAILLGLAGGLRPDLTVGTAVICHQCTDGVTGATRACDPEITQWLAERLTLPVVGGVTVAQVVSQPEEKQKLGREFAGAVVDMEGYGWLGYLPRLGMVRVVSDELHQALPALGAAVDETTGALRPLPLIWAMVRQPGAAGRLVGGSLTALARLRALTQRLTSNSEKNYNKSSSTNVSKIQT